MGKIKPTDGDLTINHLMDVYQRSRHDRHLTMIERKEEHAAVKPLLTRIQDAYNKHDGTMDVPELVYLIGMNKINIHGPDDKTVSAEAVAQSNKEIDKVIAIGLKGIREENRKLRAEKLQAEGVLEAGTGANSDFQKRVGSAIRKDQDKDKSFVDRFADVSIRTTQSALSKIGVLPKRPESYISAADPTELIGGDSGIRLG